jgi:HTH-type transcriptional regulator / antitoxin HigA
MTFDLKPLRSEADYKLALKAAEALMGAKSRSPEGERLDILVALIEAYEAGHFPMNCR